MGLVLMLYLHRKYVVLLNWLGGADGYCREVFLLGIVSSSK